MNINQDADQDVLSEFQRSPFFKGMATNRLNLYILYVVIDLFHGSMYVASEMTAHHTLLMQC